MWHSAIPNEYASAVP